jgi:NitT/TauT family transport system ATP-binding protein
MIRRATASGQAVAPDNRGAVHARSETACRAPDTSARGHFHDGLRSIEQRSEAAPLLRVMDINKVFATPEGDISVLENISFDVMSGEFISVIGPSGCGKTTLFNIVGGLADDFEGQVVLDGVVATARRHSIGMVFQDESSFPWRTAIDNVAFPLEVAGMSRRERRERARHFIHLVGLDGFEHRYPAELSGGMRQRIVLARTLAFEPKILLMDEPFAALDSQTRLLLGDKILQIQRELDQTSLLITHNLTEAVQLSDRVVVMTYRPGRVKRIVDIDLPRPRSSEIVGSEHFGHLVGSIWDDLREEASRGMSDPQVQLANPGGTENGAPGAGEYSKTL